MSSGEVCSTNESSRNFRRTTSVPTRPVQLDVQSAEKLLSAKSSSTDDGNTPTADSKSPVVSTVRRFSVTRVADDVPTDLITDNHTGANDVFQAASNLGPNRFRHNLRLRMGPIADSTHDGPNSSPGELSSTESSTMPMAMNHSVYSMAKSELSPNSMTWSGSTAARRGLRLPDLFDNSAGRSGSSTANVYATVDRANRQFAHPGMFNKGGIGYSSSSNSLRQFEDELFFHHRTNKLDVIKKEKLNDDWVDSPVDLRQFGTLSTNFAAKHLNEHSLPKYGLKTKLAKYQSFMDRSFTLIQSGTDTAVIQGMTLMRKIISKAWSDLKFGHDLAYGICDYIRENGYLLYMVKHYSNLDEENDVRLSVGGALEECLSGPNREMILDSPFLNPLLKAIEQECGNGCGEGLRISMSLLESLFKVNVRSCSRIIDLGGLDSLLRACKTCGDSKTMRHAAMALSNLAMFGGNENHSHLLARNVPEWLFLLASMQDDVTRYYACLSICILVSNQEIEAAVVKSGTLGLVEPFLVAHRPEEFAACDGRHMQGRPQLWLERLVPLLTSKRREARSLAAFHLVMEAVIKKKQERLDVFQVIHAIKPLKELASSPDEVPANFARQALEVIGETVPRKLTEDVPLWTVEDVRFWIGKIGFADYADRFARLQVDGDILLLMTDEELKDDIGIQSTLLRKRFWRELKALKITADYGCVDESRLDKFLMSISTDFSVYTYRMLEAGVDRQIFPKLTSDILETECRIKNGIHRMKILEAIEDVRHIDDMEVAILRKHVDIFVSYRRNSGSQLASLLKVLLQLKGYKVFIDIDRLYAGQFDSSLLMNIKAAKTFVLVLSPGALDRCIGDDDSCDDWIHKEIKCALENGKNIIPILTPQFVWPDDNLLPEDMRAIVRFNSIRWIHEYQEACVDKIDKFIKGDAGCLQRQNSLPQQTCAIRPAKWNGVGSPLAQAGSPNALSSLSPLRSPSLVDVADEVQLNNISSGSIPVESHTITEEENPVR